MTPQENMIQIYTRLHENRYDHVDKARKARDMQTEIHSLKEELEKVKAELEYIKNRAPIV